MNEQFWNKVHMFTLLVKTPKYQGIKNKKLKLKYQNIILNKNKRLI